MFRALIIATAASAVGILSAAAEPSVGRIEAPAGPEAPAPIGWIDFCMRYRGECDDAELPAQRIALKPRIWDELQSSNNLINRTIEPVSDWVHWHLAEKWDYPSDGKGDCEDYALLKRKLLMEHGYPRQALLLTVVYRPDDREGHAVLMVKTDGGDLILDNRRDTILNWDDTGYEFIKRQSQENQNRWVRFETPVPAPLAVSAQSDAGE